MDSKKIGAFISERRKELSLTQLELAKRLNITDRAISKWENGRGMPDISLIKPLCDELQITVNDMLSGEKLQENEIKAKCEENIINTLDYSKKKQKRFVKIIVSIIILIVLPVIILFSMFLIDINRMHNNQPILFSTWGFDYFPPIDLNPEKIEITLENHMAETLDKKYEDEKYFIASKVYLIEEIETNEFDKKFIVYAWIRGESRRLLENGILDKVNNISMPYKFVIEKNSYDLNNKYNVIETIYPRDGSLYKEDMQRIFPKEVLKEMDNFHNDGSQELLILEINEQIKLYYGLEF